MPHMCTRCGSLFEEGMDILEGCPVCGWNKFLFVKSKEKIKEVRGALKASEIGGPYEPWPEGNDSLRKILKSDEARSRRTALEKEDRRAKSKEKRKPKDRTAKDRTAKDRTAKDRTAKDRTDKDRTPTDRDERKHGFFDLDSDKDRSQDLPLQRPGKIRHQEDKTLESIRMSEPGTYELNLPSLFERDELVMAVKDGTYLIDLSSAFKKQKKG
jgi:predicted  nucleic acid-binding Zn-ribbon protein